MQSSAYLVISGHPNILETFLDRIGEHLGGPKGRIGAHPKYSDLLLTSVFLAQILAY